MQDRTPPPQISLIVISYNTRKMTLLVSFQSLPEVETTPFELMVGVDNASTDGSAKAIAETFS
jgi:glycosyltransferase involved in cell wall biosynthesis